MLSSRGLKVLCKFENLKKKKIFSTQFLHIFCKKKFANIFTQNLHTILHIFLQKSKELEVAMPFIPQPNWSYVFDQKS